MTATLSSEEKLLTEKDKKLIEKDEQMIANEKKMQSIYDEVKQEGQKLK